MRLLASVLSLSALTIGVAHADDVTVPAPLPAMGYVGSLEDDEMYNLVKAEPLFTTLNKDLVGSPIVLRVTHALEPTAGGKAAGLASAIFAGSTLGLLPVVLNNDLVVYYDIIVNGSVLTTTSYRKNFTVSMNMWSKDKTHGLGESGLAWLKSTVHEYSMAASHDPKLAALVQEYQFYFASAKP